MYFKLQFLNLIGYKQIQNFGKALERYCRHKNWALPYVEEIENIFLYMSFQIVSAAAGYFARKPLHSTCTHSFAVFPLQKRQLAWFISAEACSIWFDHSLAYSIFKRLTTMQLLTLKLLSFVSQSFVFRIALPNIFHEHYIYRKISVFL